MKDIVENVEEVESVEDNFSVDVEVVEVRAEVKEEEAEHESEALASGSVRKQYSSS